MATVYNLCFHGIGEPARELEDGEGRYWITPEVYAGVLDLVSGRNDCRLSFDDGNASDHEIGLPGLLERGLRATFFVLAGRLDRPGSLSRAQVRDLEARGMTVGTHGMDHVPWRGLDDAGCRRELLEARDVIAGVVRSPVEEAALPLGRYDRRLLRRLRQAGYAGVFSSDRRPARSGAWLQPRFSVRDDDTVDSVRASLARPPLRKVAKLEAVGLVKRLR